MSESARTLLLASVAGSARRHERLDDADASRAVERCLKRIERAVESCGGRLVFALGGEAMAVFAQAADALQAADEMQLRVGEMTPQAGIRLALRVGLAHGAFDEHDEAEQALGATQRAAAHLAGQAQAGQVLLCPATRAALPVPWSLRTREVGTVALAGRVAAMRVFELTSGAPAVASTATGAAFCLRYGDRVWRLDERRPAISVGRDAANDVEVRDRRASRRHATIEKRGDHVYLVDHSSNGSYVTNKGQNEVFVRASEFLLHGSGVISFAASSASLGADCAQFDEHGARRDVPE